MPLDFTVQQYPFRLGVDEGTDPRQVPPGTLLRAENVEWLKTGQLGKRGGATALSSGIIGGGNLTSIERLLVRGDELAAVSGSTLYARSTTAASWKSIGKVPDLGVTWETAGDTLRGVIAFDAARSAGGYRIEAWVTGDAATGTTGALFVRIVDDADGSTIVVPTRLASANALGVRVLVLSSTAIILTRSSSTNMVAYTVNLSTFAVSAGTNLATDGVTVDGADAWDACIIGSTFVIAYCSTGPALTLLSFNSSLVLQAAGGITTEVDGATAISIDGAAGEVLYVLYQDGAAAPSDVLLAIANPATLVETVAPVSVETGPAGAKAERLGVCRYDATNCVLAYSMPDVGVNNNRRTTTYKASSGAVIATTTLRATYGTTPISRPVMLGGSCWMILAERLTSATESDPADSNSVAVEVEVSTTALTNAPHRLVGCIDRLIGGIGSLIGTGAPTNGWCSVSATKMRALVPFQATTQQRVIRQGLRCVTMTLGADRPGDLWRTVTAGSECFIAGGVLTSYDGLDTFDYGFSIAPAFLSLAGSNGAGSMSLGKYLYGVLQEYRSGTGLIYRSPTQQVGDVTLAGAEDTVTARLYTSSVGNKQTTTTGLGAVASKPVLLPWYRTVVTGTVRQRLTVEPTYNVSYFDASTSETTFTDLRNDTDTGATIALSARPAIYTQGGILDDFAPPSCVTQFTYADRLFVLTGDRRTWWYSKSFQDDLGVAPGFHPNFRLVFDDAQTCGATMDDKAVFFSSTGISYMQGAGPAPDGTASDFTVPLQIQTDVGCANGRCLVSVPSGLMFDSGQGIYLLGRDLQLAFVGRPVQDTLAAFPNITSGVLVASKRQVRFTCNNDDGDEHCILVFDYLENQWTTFRYTHDSVYGGGAISDAVVWNGVYTFAMTDGTVYTESSSSYLDEGSTWVPLTLKTAWISAAGPLAFHSVRRFTLHGSAVTDHNLSVLVGFDGAAASETHTFASPSAVTTAGSSDDPQVPIGTRRKCQQIQFTITDATPTSGTVGTGAGPRFDMMGIEVGIKRGLSRQPATKKG